MLRKRWDCGDGQREESGEIRVLSLSTISRSSGSRARRVGRDDGDVNEKSSNIFFCSGGFGRCGFRVNIKYESIWKYNVICVPLTGRWSGLSAFNVAIWGFRELTTYT